jgi:hypothetical protein
MKQTLVSEWAPSTDTTPGTSREWSMISNGTVSHPYREKTNMQTQMRRTRFRSAYTDNVRSGHGCCQRKKNFGDFCQKPEKKPRRLGPALGADVAANSKGTAPGAIQVENPTGLGLDAIRRCPSGLPRSHALRLLSCAVVPTQDPLGTSIIRKASS